MRVKASVGYTLEEIYLGGPTLEYMQLNKVMLTTSRE